MVIETCRFETDRLSVDEWHRGAAPDLAVIVAGLLTPAVTRALPPDWGGAYDEARATDWIASRDAEGTTLLVREGGAPVGLVLLFEEPVPGGIDLRLGYLLAEHAWGRGLGSELLAGLVAWCRRQAPIRGLIGGVAADNTASIRVLERNGFVRADAARASDGELEYRMDLAASP